MTKISCQLCIIFKLSTFLEIRFKKLPVPFNIFAKGFPWSCSRSSAAVVGKAGLLAGAADDGADTPAAYCIFEI